jgi:hypothetical protein
MSTSRSSHHFSGSFKCIHCKAEIKKERYGYFYNLNTKWHQSQEEQWCLICFNQLLTELKQKYHTEKDMML